MELPQFVSLPRVNWKGGQSLLENMAVWFLNKMGISVTRKAESSGQWPEGMRIEEGSSQQACHRKDNTEAHPGKKQFQSRDPTLMTTGLDLTG